VTQAPYSSLARNPNGAREGARNTKGAREGVRNTKGAREGARNMKEAREGAKCGRGAGSLNIEFEDSWAHVLTLWVGRKL
jgi:hypothetical protein